MRLILASSSPRRIELIKKLNLDYIVINPKIDERKILSSFCIDPLTYSSILSMKKGESVLNELSLNKDDIIISCDTIVYHKDKILNKPLNNEESFKMLTELSNDVHEVITSTSILSLNKKISFSSVSKVYFNKLSKEEISNYISSNYLLDKAGSYAIQDDKKYHLIKKIEGSYFNIVGFPLEDIKKHLEEFID